MVPNRTEGEAIEQYLRMSYALASTWHFTLCSVTFSQENMDYTKTVTNGYRVVRRMYSVVGRNNLLCK